MIFDRPEIVDYGGLGGPGRPGNLPKRWGAKPPTFLEGLPAARAAQTSKIDDFLSAKIPYIKNLGVCLGGVVAHLHAGRTCSPNLNGVVHRPNPPLLLATTQTWLHFGGL